LVHEKAILPAPVVQTQPAQPAYAVAASGQRLNGYGSSGKALPPARPAAEVPTPEAEGEYIADRLTGL
jgi:hypothetical protein